MVEPPPQTPSENICKCGDYTKNLDGRCDTCRMLDETDKEAKRRKDRQTSHILIALAVFGIILLIGFLFLPKPDQCTSDQRFCNKRPLLRCGVNDTVFNATDGKPKPDNPDFYFCTPYPDQPAYFFFYRGPNGTLTVNDAVNEKDSGISVFTRQCPLDMNPTEAFRYDIYLGDWAHHLHTKCSTYKEFTYMYSNYGGYKHFCCLPSNKVVTNSTTDVMMRLDKVLMYNETMVGIQNGSKVD